MTKRFIKIHKNLFNVLTTSQNMVYLGYQKCFWWDMKNKEVFATFYLMDTVVSVRLSGKNVRRALKQIKKKLLWFSRYYSRYDDKGQVYKINAAAGRSFVRVDRKLLALLNKAVGLSNMTGGLFDVTVGPLMDLWDFKFAISPPSEEAIRKAKSFVGYRDIIIDEKNSAVMLKHPGQKIDLGGIAKGLATDECNKIIEKFKFAQGYINIGGNVSVIGSNPNGEPWKVGIRHPRRTDHLIGMVKLENKAIVTSGDYERFFDCQGVRYHHLLNPLTGYPGKAGLTSVTVIAENGCLADALSTAVFLSGIEKSRDLLKRFPETEAVIIDETENIYITKGLIDCFEVFDQTKITII